MDYNSGMALHKKNTVARFSELMKRADTSLQYTFSEFHNISDKAFLNDAGVSGNASYSGGYELAERVVFCFGNEAQIGYPPYYPIDIVRITPASNKFGTLEHRDILGTIMGLGLTRDRIGDIKIDKDANIAYFFALDTISDYIIDNISRIRKMSVTLEKVDSIPDELLNAYEEVTVQVSSERIDCFVSGITGRSRSQASVLIAEKNVLLNGITVTKNTAAVTPGSVIVIRKFGKYIYDRCTGTTRSNNLHVVLKKYS